MTPRFIAKQLACPSGMAGKIIRLLMNRNNARMNSFAVQLLHPLPADRVLEIGFGGGLNIPELLNSCKFVAGLDRSNDAVASAQARFSSEINCGKAAFHSGVAECLPFPAKSFQKVLAVNTVYFWKTLAGPLSEIHRILAPGGWGAIGFLPKDHMEKKGMPPDIFTQRTSEDVLDSLRSAGFQDLKILRPTPSTPWNVILFSR